MRDMASHAEKMRILTENRDNRALKYDIWHTKIEHVVAELGKKNLSIDGTIEQTRDRLLRVVAREAGVCPDGALVRAGREGIC